MLLTGGLLGEIHRFMKDKVNPRRAGVKMPDNINAERNMLLSRQENFLAIFEAMDSIDSIDFELPCKSKLSLQFYFHMRFPVRPPVISVCISVSQFCSLRLC